MTTHTHSYWLDFGKDKVFCSRFCGKSFDPSELIKEFGAEWSLTITESLLPQYKGEKIYLVRYSGKYLCSITGYSQGVLHLLDFKEKDQYFEKFKRVVSECFGVNHIQIEEELKNESKSL